MEEHLYEQMALLEARHFWFRGRCEALRGVTERCLGSPSAAGLRIADVGCGTGANLEWLASQIRPCLGNRRQRSGLPQRNGEHQNKA